MDKIVGNVISTDDYGKFKRIRGNRNTNKHLNMKHVAELVASMVKNGWIGAPIIVDQLMRIVDGQHRLEAAEQAGIPVLYFVVENATIETCIELNKNHKAWAGLDYIGSYAERGSGEYKALLELVEKYVGHNGITQNVVIAVCQGNLQGVNSKAIKDGTFAFRDANEAKSILEYLSRFDVRNVAGRRESLLYALNGFYRMDCVDNDKMVNQFAKHGSDIKRCTNIPDAVEQLEMVYNAHSGRKVYLVDKYRQLADEMCAALPGGKPRDKENA